MNHRNKIFCVWGWSNIIYNNKWKDIQALQIFTNSSVEA